MEAAYFQDKFGIDPRQRFAEVLAGHQAAGWLQVTDEGVVATREGLLRIDSLLGDFFAPEHQGARYA